MGTSLQAQKLTAAHFGGEQYNGCNDYLVISYPQAVEKVHRSFLEVGVDVLETDTFRSNRLTLAEYGLEERSDRDQPGRGRAWRAAWRTNIPPPSSRASWPARSALRQAALRRRPGAVQRHLRRAGGCLPRAGRSG